jgi:hypothetical protein
MYRAPADGRYVQLGNVDGVRADRLAAAPRGRTWRVPCPTISIHKKLEEMAMRKALRRARTEQRR